MFPKITLLATVAALAPFGAHAQYVMTTVAGSVGRSFPAAANGGQATAAPLASVHGVAVDSAGNVYAADTDDNLVVRISSAGVLTVVAGTPNRGYGFAGDGGPATSALLNQPVAVALDIAGNLYIADSLNYRVRKINASGVISTFAGTGQFGSAGDGGPATSAQLSAPQGLTVDTAGHLYIADYQNNSVRKVDGNGTITRVAGNGQRGFAGDGGPATAAKLNSPQGVAVDTAGNLYIADYGNNSVRKVDGKGTIRTVAGNGQRGFSGDGGSATDAELNWPEGVAVDTVGDVYIADSFNARIRRVTPAGTITTVTGTGVPGFSGDGGPATGAQLSFPQGVVVDTNGNQYIGDQRRLRKVGSGGTISTIAGSGSALFFGDGGPATSATLGWTDGVAVGAGGVYISDSTNNRIRKVTSDGIIRTVAGTDGGFSGDTGPAVGAQLAYPRGLALDAAGALYIADVGSSRIRKVSPDGTITTVAGNGQPGYSGDGGPAASAQLYYPQGVALDRKTGNLYIADSSNSRIRVVSPQGTISTVAGTGHSGFSGDGGLASNAQLASPSSIAVDAAGNLYIVDSSVCYPEPCAAGLSLSNQRIRKVDTTGTITTVAGNGQDGFSGDGGPAINAALCFPEGVAVDAAGNLYIVDSGNDRIRKVDTHGMITTVLFIMDGGEGYGFNLSVQDYLKAGGAVTFDAAGNLYIADWLDGVVFKANELVTPYLLGIRNSANGSNSGSPGSLFTLYGFNLASGTQPSAGVTSLLDTTVTVSGFPAPLLYVSPTQINAQIPFDAPLATDLIEVSRPSTGATSAPLPVAAASPGIFRLVGLQGAILTSTGEVAAPSGSLADRPARPANRGEYVSIFCTGLGDVTNRPANAAPASAGPPYSETLLRPLVTIGGIPVAPVFSGLAPGFVGLYQVNVQVPANAPTGSAVQLTISIGGASDSDFMAVQ